MALNKRNNSKEVQPQKVSVLNRVKTTLPKNIFETEAKKLNNQFAKMIVNR